MGRAKKQLPVVTKPHIFIGSSAEALPTAKYLQAELDYKFTADVWTAGAMKPSQSPLDSLLAKMADATFGAFVFTPDDIVVSRGRSRPGVRDNLLIELGLFIGRLGKSRCFVLTPRDQKRLKMPSDLEGYNPITYDSSGSGRAGLTTAATEITEAAERLGAFRPHPPAAYSYPVEAFADQVSELLKPLAAWRAAWELPPPNKAKFEWWAEEVVSSADRALRRVAALPADAYVTWLRPRGKGAQRRLTVFVSHNLPQDYQPHLFALGEGLAGRVWESGGEGLHTAARPHPAWKVRPGCDNQSYLCVSVGEPSGSGGVLAVGSDAGFEATSELAALLRGHAAILSVAVG